MGGSGLTDVLSTCYAKATVDKMLTGHAYSRAVRGHTLVYLALCKRIFKEASFSEKEQEVIENWLSLCITDEHDFGKLEKAVDLTAVKERFLKEIGNFEIRGKTANLWV